MCGRRATCKKIYIIFVPSVHSRSIHHLYWKIFEYFIYGYSMWKSYNRCFFMREYFMAAYYKWPLIYVRSLRGSRSCLIFFFYSLCFPIRRNKFEYFIIRFWRGSIGIDYTYFDGTSMLLYQFFFAFPFRAIKKNFRYALTIKND